MRLFVFLGLVAFASSVAPKRAEDHQAAWRAQAATAPCLNSGCKPGTGLKVYNITSTTVRDPQWALCGGDCEALIYGGHMGKGTLQGQNEYGAATPYTKTYPVPLTTGEVVVGARIIMIASIDSGYTYPLEPPYTMTITMNDVVVGDHIQLLGLQRNPTWLGIPDPPDHNLRTWTYRIPDSALWTIAVHNNSARIHYDLVTAGWMTIEKTTFQVEVCSTSCTCHRSGREGYWTGNWCTTCLSGFKGQYCTSNTTCEDRLAAEMLASSGGSIETVRSSDTDDYTAYQAAVGILAATTFFAVAFACYFQRRYAMLTSGTSNVKPVQQVEGLPPSMSMGN